MFAHEKLDIYNVSIEFVAYALEIATGIPKGNGDFVTQLRRSAASIPANIAVGVGKTGRSDQRRYLAIARGSATEAASWYDVLLVLSQAPRLLMRNCF